MSQLHPDDWKRVRKILAEALEADGPARAAVLDRECGADFDLRRRVESLLRIDQALESEPGASRFLDAAVGDYSSSLFRKLDQIPGIVGETAASPESRIGHTLGPYTIASVLGEGGMGVVYEAEQASPRRRVALKVVRGGALVDSRRLRLFQREVETLGLLRHHGIAAIYEAGRTDEGEHFFAMEIVRGIPLSEHLRAQGTVDSIDRAEVRRRLALFLEICDAISYAHQRGVIHRDLKPSNIIVAADQGESAAERAGGGSRIKILDFGLARITDGDLALATMQTEVKTIQGTLPYMSPEQARGDPAEIDLRSDIYSLGILLYEMLTGELPYDVRDRALHEALRAICEDPPRRPSMTRPHLKGDIETILLKTIEKDPAGRYQSVSDLADEIRRSLNDLPIQARPHSTIYQLRKLATRHKTAATLTAALAAALILGMIGTTWGMLRARAAESAARKEAETAKQVTQFVEGLFRVSNPTESKGNSITAREVLDRGAAEMEGRLGEQPEVKARLLATIGAVYRNLGLYRESVPLLEESLALRVEALGAGTLDVAEGQYLLAGVLRRLGRYDEARDLYERSLATRERLLGADAPDVASGISGVANIFFHLGEYEKARPLYERAVAIYEKTKGKDHPDLAAPLSNLALLLQAAGEAGSARPLLDRAVRIEETAYGPDDPRVALDLLTLGVVESDLGEFAQAKTHLERAIAIQVGSLGADHSDLGGSRNALATVLGSMGDLGGARREFEEARRILTLSLGEDHPDVAMLSDNLAGTLRDQGDLDGAERLSTEALSVLEKSLGPDHPSVATTLTRIAGIKLLRGDRQRARELYERALAIRERSLAPESPEVTEIDVALGRLHAEGGDTDAARRYFARAWIALQQERGPVSPRSREFCAECARFFRSTGESAVAEAIETRGQAAP